MNIIEIIVAFLIILVAVLFVVLVLKILLVLLPAFIVAIVVWFLTHNSIYAAVAFLLVSLIALVKRL